MKYHFEIRIFHLRQFLTFVGPCERETLKSFNFFFRQDSELQSQSSGAAVGGDTTDDNYSSFKPPEPRLIRPTTRSDRKKGHHPGPTTHATSSVPKNKENTQFIPRPKIPLDPYNLATNDPTKFAEKLFAKLSKIEDDQAKESKLRGMLELNRTR